ncbi:MULTISPECIES: GTPase Era [unclassified Synechocystis]|uniref:GTPase Era n=1 Tax=unclassified Synechocystis TaxID=2640012 RepID=UPI0003FD06F8|nr:MULTISPECIES: GTPase Era [unclassified Synechocystis]AIE75496.1 GTP-binding protein Era [Synechocystis sp. PCC 6714]MCT0253711.1 GTPase Era [Synechocystis sp. CS-94]
MDILEPSTSIPLAPPDFRSGFVAIVGRPNVGKSTLMNQLVGQKIAITSPVAQTTRNRLRGIVTTPTCQMILLDTPGIHKPHHELGRVLVKNAIQAIHSVDLIVFLVDSSVPLGRGDQFVVDLLQKGDAPVVVGLNKQDQQPREEGEKINASYETLTESYGWPCFKFSALTGEGLVNFQRALSAKLELGPYYYPPDLVTDQPERFIMAELIREQILLLTRQEVPHSVAIAIEKVEETPQRTNVFAAITVERGSQKGIIIGQKGSMLQAIGSAARQQIQKLIAGDIYLKLFVKVEPKWRQSRQQLLEFGYRVEE